MIALAFLNPLLLSGLGLAALPIVIHLLSRRQFRRVEWAAMRFLLEAEKQNRRRVRFEQWLLLALRCLAMALLALLVARPFMRPSVVSSLLGGRGEVRRIVLLDDSASLGYRGGANTDFAALRASAERLHEWLRQESPADSIALYVTSQPEKPLIETGHVSEISTEEWRSRLARIRPTDAAAHPSRALEVLVAGLADVKTPIELYVLSDFQRADWLGRVPAQFASDPRQPELRPDEPAAFEPLRKHAEAVRVILVAAGAPARENVGIESLRLDRPLAVVGVPTLARVRVLNDTRRALRDVRLEVEVDGSPQLGSQIESVEPGQTREVGVEVVFSEEGRRTLAVRLAAGDALSSDDVCRAAFDVKPRLDVLLVNGQPSSDPLRDEVQLPRNALAPPGPFSSGIAVETIDAADLEASDLRRFDCIFLCNVPAPSEGAAALLKSYVREGGGLAVFLGDEVGDGSEYNRMLGASGADLLPFPIQGPPVKSAKMGGAGLIRTGENPITAAFPSGQENLSEYVHFRSYFPLASEPEKPISIKSQQHPVVLARFTDEAQPPALVQKRIGRGRVVLFASTIDLDWNDWARAVDGSYVVTLLELVQNLARGSANLAYFRAGSTIAMWASAEEYDPRVVIRTPAYPDEPVIESRLTERRDATTQPSQEMSEVLDDLVEVRGPRALLAGIYRLLLTRRSDGASVEWPVCVNCDPSESRLAAATQAELDAALGPIPHDYLTANEAFGGGQTPARRELWPTILALIVLVLMMEQALACWFGRPVGGAVRGRERFVMAAR